MLAWISFDILFLLRILYPKASVPWKLSTIWDVPIWTAEFAVGRCGTVGRCGIYAVVVGSKSYCCTISQEVWISSRTCSYTQNKKGATWSILFWLPFSKQKCQVPNRIYVYSIHIWYMIYMYKYIYIYMIYVNIYPKTWAKQTILFRT